MDSSADWVLIGLVVGVPIGVCLGWILSQIIRPATGGQGQTPASVLFDRDEHGRVSGIHYASIGGKA